jgi:RES domain-containing protein
MLEQLARAGIGHIPKGQMWIEINIPAIAIEVVEPEDIPRWDREDRMASQAYGDQWLRDQRTAVLVMPSVVANGLENNVIINPAHKDFGKITCTEPKGMEWHQRLLVPPSTTEKKK